MVVVVVVVGGVGEGGGVSMAASMAASGGTVIFPLTPGSCYPKVGGGLEQWSCCPITSRSNMAGDIILKKTTD